MLESKVLEGSDKILHQLGFVDGAILTLVCSASEQHLNPQVLQMLGLEHVQSLEEQVMQDYVKDYRLRRQTVAFAKKVAESRAPHRAVDFPSASGMCRGCRPKC